MKHLFLLFGCTFILAAAPTDLASLLAAADRSDAARASAYALQAQRLRQQGELLPDTANLALQGGYADSKNSSDSAFEYHITVEKPFRLADTGRLETLFGESSDIGMRLQRAQLQNRVYAYYIDACTLQEELWLLQDERGRGMQMSRLIRTGMEGGEFDRSAWLRSRLNVQNITTQLRTLTSRYEQTLLMLGALTQTPVEEPLCRDLPDTISRPLPERFADAPLLGQLENRRAEAQARGDYADAWPRTVTLGAGYDDELDLRRGIVYAAIPLGGERRDNEREAARRDALAADAELGALRSELDAGIAAFVSAQWMRKRNLQRLNDKLIPEAYETTVLLEERFMGSEASYLEYIDSQKALFALLHEGVILRAEALRAEAELSARLGLSPLTRKDPQ